MDTVALVGRLLVSLAAVLGVMWLIGRRMRKNMRGKDNRLIDVLARQQLSRNSSVAVVRVMDQALIIGITESQVQMLGETDLATVQALSAELDRPARPARIARTPRRTSSPRGTGSSRRPLAGSILSPRTWKQTLESLRDLTNRSS